ncbi:hypothetical protein WIS52_26340 [Pseudonocardia nematodicida]|uniref:PspA domain-containing protein n=1 Tax=Pseudonocardia nematodicida TaxID=1206997 RepID=A0ABV1KJG4_9PSEU
MSEQRDQHDRTSLPAPVEPATGAPAVSEPGVPEPGVPEPVVPATDYTDDGVPTFDYVRDKIEKRSATAAVSEELAGGDTTAQQAEDAFADRERKAADKLAEIRRSMGR